MRQLTDRANSISAGRFRAPGATGDFPGLYSWWCDEAGIAVLSHPFETKLRPLIYVGQAGATSHAIATNTATLRSRIVGNHLGGNIGSSTFRRTLAALLMHPLRLVVSHPGALDQASNRRLTEWMTAHLSVVTAVYPDRSTLGAVEATVLAEIDPPLNLDGMPRTPMRRRLRELRQAVAVARRVPGSPDQIATRSPVGPSRRRMSEDLLARITAAVSPGDVVTTLGHGRPNTIVAIGADGVEVETDRSHGLSSGPQLVPAWMIERVWNHLVTTHRITLQHMLASDGLDVKRSSFVAALLAQLEDVYVSSTRPIELVYRPDHERT